MNSGSTLIPRCSDLFDIIVHYCLMFKRVLTDLYENVEMLCFSVTLLKNNVNKFMDMGKYERPSFRKEWWEDVREYLEDNPDEGFDSEDVKEFIKFSVNLRMQSNEKELAEMLKGKSLNEIRDALLEVTDE